MYVLDPIGFNCLRIDAILLGCFLPDSSFDLLFSVFKRIVVDFCAHRNTKISPENSQYSGSVNLSVPVPGLFDYQKDGKTGTVSIHSKWYSRAQRTESLQSASVE